MFKPAFGLSASAFVLLSLAAQAASITLVPLPQALTAAPSARALLQKESAQAGGPDFTPGSATDTSPVTSVECLVEVFKLRGGTFKRADMHHGTYPLGSFYRREVIKELEVGTGEIPGTASGNDWLFEPTTLYRLIQDYSADRAAYGSVKFDRSVSWRIEARLGSDQKYEVRSPELSVELSSGR